MLGDQAEWLMLIMGKERGVSLIEVMVAVIIVSLLLGFAATSYSGWIQNQQTRTAAESILNGLQVARSEAVKNNRRARFVLCGLPASSWEVLVASAAAPAPAASLVCGAGSDAAAGEVRVQERSGQEGSRFAQVAVTPGGATTVTFNSFGRVVDVAPITSIGVSNPNGDRPLQITLQAGGSARMCDPSPLLAATDPRHC